jgi:general nucleoside transport system permease protein
MMRFSVQIIKREIPSRMMLVLAPFIAVFCAFLVGGLLSAWMGINPLDLFSAMIKGLVKSKNGITEVLLKFSPILLCSLGIAIAFRAGFWNIGAEGQIFMGAVFAFGAASFTTNWPSLFAISFVVVSGFIGGALWGVIPAVLKLRYAVNEIVTTLMLNYVAKYFLFYLVHGPWKMPNYLYPWSSPIPASAIIPKIPGTRIHFGVFLGVGALIVISVLIHKTYFGYRAKFIGSNTEVAKVNGMNVGKTLIIIMIISGGLAGLAGMGEVAGVHLRLKEQMSLGYGFTAITAALLGRLTPIGTAVGAFTISVLVVCGQYIQRTMSVPYSYVESLTSLVVLFLIISWLTSEYSFRINVKKKEIEENYA